MHSKINKLKQNEEQKKIPKQPSEGLNSLQLKKKRNIHSTAEILKMCYLLMLIIYDLSLVFIHLNH